MPNIIKKVDKLYDVRFSDKDKLAKAKIWKVLCETFLQKFIPAKATVIDLAAGYCEFINHIQASKKYAIDINPDVKKYADKNVEVILSPAEKMPKKLTGKVDIVFAGCFLEHLPSKDAIFQVFLEVKKILKPGGKFLILNPNIRLSTSDYWDYFDHLTPVSDRSVVEGLELAGFQIEKVIPGFVPNTTKDQLPKNPILVKIYLQLPFLFKIFGRQMFIVARKS